MSNIEEHIRRAMQEGQFDNLPGKGKPLHLDDNPFEDPEWHLAYHVLRNSGFSLPWIEKRRELEEAIEAARKALRIKWSWRESALASNQPLAAINAEWARARENFCRQVDELNQQIMSYNLEAPSERFHLPRLNAEREITLTTSPASDKL